MTKEEIGKYKLHQEVKVVDSGHPHREEIGRVKAIIETQDALNNTTYSLKLKMEENEILISDDKQITPENK